MRRLLILTIFSIAAGGCDDSAARQKNYDNLARAIQTVMCTASTDERAAALGRVVELASHEADGDAWVLVQDTAVDTECSGSSNNSTAAQ